MFLICGEALFDLFGDAASGDSQSFDARIGGSPFNVAMGLARLDEEVCFFGGISGDTLGGQLIRKLRSEGISDRYVVRSGHLTTLSLVQKDDHGHPAYTFYGTDAADRMIREEHLPDFTGSPLFIHVGSFSALVEPIATTLKTLIKRERQTSLISFDPNIRPTVVADMSKWRENTNALVLLADIIKVSDEDLEMMWPNEPAADIARSWLSQGVKLVVVTKGKDGASAYMSGKEVDCPGVPVTVEDTVGAGDTFQAALLSGLAQLGAASRSSLAALDETRLRSLLGFAIKAAAITCSRRGADLPRKAELEKEWSALT